jgi:hypothetical protein
MGADVETSDTRMRCEAATLQMAPYCVLGDQIAAGRVVATRNKPACLYEQRWAVCGQRCRGHGTVAFSGSGARQDCLIVSASRNGLGTRMGRDVCTRTSIGVAVIASRHGIQCDVLLSALCGRLVRSISTDDSDAVLGRVMALQVGSGSPLELSARRAPRRPNTRLVQSHAL